MPRSGPFPVIAQPTSQADIRSHAIDRKRHKEKKTKWAPKWSSPKVPAIREAPNGTQRPKQRISQMNAAHIHAQLEKDMRKKRQHQRAQLNDSEDGTSADTSADERAPDTHEEDVEVYEPFKSRGEAVLEMALDKAVEQYEDKQTSRLVDDEYEVLQKEPNPGRSRRVSLDLADEDEGFELV